MSAEDEAVQALFRQHRQTLSHRPSPGLAARLGFPVRSRVAWVLGSAAACLALLLSFELGLRSARDREEEALLQEVLSGHVRSLMVDHLSDVASTDQHTVKPWFLGKLDYAPTVADFSSDGFPLVGGRLDFVGSRPVAVLIYRANQHVLNLFQWPTSDGALREPRFLTRRGFQVFTWQRDSMVFWVVSDVNAGELQRFAQLWNR